MNDANIRILILATLLIIFTTGCLDNDGSGSESDDDDNGADADSDGDSDGDSDTDSFCEVPLSGIFIQFDVVEESGEAVASAVFWEGDSPGGTSFVLGQHGCEEWFSVNGEIGYLVPGDPNRYEVSILISEEYEFVYSRSGEGVYTSIVTTPIQVIIILPQEGGDYARSQDTSIEWEYNEVAIIELLVRGDCFYDFPKPGGDHVTDNGFHTIGAGYLEPYEGQEDANCDAEVVLTRHSSGTLDSEIEGSITGRNRSRVHFTSVP